MNGRQLRDRQNEVLFMDLRRCDDHIEQYSVEKGTKKKKTILDDEQIAKVKSIYQAWQEGTVIVFWLPKEEALV